MESRQNYRFGVAGELRREDGQQPEIVAVKVLKESATREAEEDFMREVDIMSAFRHCNILSLIGVVLRGEDLACSYISCAFTY